MLFGGYERHVDGRRQSCLKEVRRLREKITATKLNEDG